ncbi:tetratricopeptide repeat protein [Sphingomonas sp. IC-11]|uniref:tetratricopeptide repeat protein n=1 Tax=Sphingomonas sp. IC-11 TaxID=2898528 RepID=UPI001E3E9682|nr:tetratricopeptide repeat protein [Sphingomonas sp. IC-11]MCD2314607.1 tetratricopeptide repeat protein [Sphingomonas sp. IC-11]
MIEEGRRYPLLRRRRRSRTGASAGMGKASWRMARVVAMLVVTALVLAAIVLVARRASRPDPDEALRASFAALKRGNYSAARNHALVAADGPDAGRGNAVLGRVYLLLGDGAAAEGALNRAVAAGMPRARLHQLLADAYLLQGNADRALSEAAHASGRYAAYAARVRARAMATKGDVPGATALLNTILSRSPNDASAWADLGRIRMAAGDVAAADLAARRAVALAPASLDAIVLSGEVVRSRYGLTAALPWFGRALELDAYYLPALIQYAATAGDAGQYTGMLQATRRALAARPNHPQALYLQAVMAARAGNRDLARALLGRMGDAGLAMPGVVLLTGMIAYADGAYEQAVVSFREIVGRQPMNLVARRLLGASLLRSGDARGALDVLRPIAVRADADSYTLALVGRAFEATGERDWAARFLDRAARPALADPELFASDGSTGTLAAAVAGAPGDPAIAVAYVRSLLDAGEVAAAEQRARAIATASPGAPEAQLLAGDILAIQRRFGPALVRYRQAANLRFDMPALLRLAEAANRTGDGREAVSALSLYRAQNPQAIAAHRALANLQLGARDWTGAVETLERLRHNVGERDALIHAQLAYAYTAAGDPQGGAEHGRTAYQLSPMNPAASDAYGWALYEAGDTGAALQLLEKAAKLAPAHAGIRWHLGQALAEAGRTVEARQAITQVLRDPGFPDRAPAAALLKLLGH